MDTIRYQLMKIVRQLTTLYPNAFWGGAQMSIWTASMGKLERELKLKDSIECVVVFVQKVLIGNYLLTSRGDYMFKLCLQLVELQPSGFMSTFECGNLIWHRLFPSSLAPCRSLTSETFVVTAIDYTKKTDLFTMVIFEGKLALTGFAETEL